MKQQSDDSRVTTNPTHDPPQSPDQLRAADALRSVQQLDEDVQLRKRYRAYTDRIGPAILMNGLGQALATERAAATSAPKKPDERAHERLYRNLQAWLCRPGGIFEPENDREDDLLNAIVNHSEKHYLRAQTEALAWLVWHKKFCRAYLPSSDPLESEDG